MNCNCVNKFIHLRANLRGGLFFAPNTSLYVALLPSLPRNMNGCAAKLITLYSFNHRASRLCSCPFVPLSIFTGPGVAVLHKPEVVPIRIRTGREPAVQFYVLMATAEPSGSERGALDEKATVVLAAGSQPVHVI